MIEKKKVISHYNKTKISIKLYLTAYVLPSIAQAMVAFHNFLILTHLQ